jgi:hypothetical protein
VSASYDAVDGEVAGVTLRVERHAPVAKPVAAAHSMPTTRNELKQRRVRLTKWCLMRALPAQYSGMSKPDSGDASDKARIDVAGAYDQWARQYDNDHNTTRDLDARVLRDAPLRLDDRAVIELGCGTGKNTAWLAVARAWRVARNERRAGNCAEAAVGVV